MLAAMMALLLLPADPAVGLRAATPGTVVVALPDGEDGAYADGVGQALGEANFTLMPGPGHSRYVAEVVVGREGKGVVTAKAPTGRASAAIGSWGPALAVPLGTKKTQLHDLVLTTLTIRLLSADDRQPVWTGSAVTAQAEGTPAGAPPAVALKLARAAVSAFPRTMDQPISVP